VKPRVSASFTSRDQRRAPPSPIANAQMRVQIGASPRAMRTSIAIWSTSMFPPSSRRVARTTAEPASIVISVSYQTRASSRTKGSGSESRGTATRSIESGRCSKRWSSIMPNVAPPNSAMALAKVKTRRKIRFGAASPDGAAGAASRPGELARAIDTSGPTKLHRALGKRQVAAQPTS
jgi:hypothetical protein